MLDTNHLPDFAGCFRIRTHDPVANSEWRVFECSRLATRGGFSLFRVQRPRACARAQADKAMRDGQMTNAVAHKV
jgi:hypothetical protein